MIGPRLSRVALAASLLVSASARAAVFASHAPLRPLPIASARPLGTGPAFYVDPTHGDDAAAGSAKAPWRTIQHAVGQLHAGDTLYLHGGVYFESVTLTSSGTAKAPITIRSAPGELAIIDGGLREFEESPKTAWQAAAGGAGGEYESTATYPNLSEASGKERGVWVLGSFADSMVPLHGYRFVADLRSDNPYWNLTDKVAPDQAIWNGPGVWFDWKTHRIHARLAHTALAGLGDNYAGETDPRKLALVIGVDKSALHVDGADHWRIQDLVFRGAAIATVRIDSADDVELDGVTIYGGSPAMAVRSTSHLRVTRSALRGIAAPWSSRASLKYRGASPYLFVAESKAPQSHDWELAYDEFTDGHDGIVIDSVKTLRLHHDRIDNFDDDGIYLTLPPRDSVPEDVQIYQNVITRVLTTFAFAEPDDRKPNTTGPGVYVFRNVFDLRDGTFGWPPADANADKAPLTQASRMCGDHGSPTWEPLFFYQNTVITAGPTWRDYYGAMLVMGTGKTTRRLFDNVFVQVDGKPGLVVPVPSDDVKVDGNLMWSVAAGPSVSGDFFASARPGPHDRFGDPKWAKLSQGVPADVRLGAGSAAIDAGVPVPTAWPDPLRAADKGAPDAGALPSGASVLEVGPAAAPAITH